MEALHGHEQGNPHAVDDGAAVLNAFFKRGMLTARAERLIDLVLPELELGASGHWTADRVKDWIEQEKSRISQQDQIEEVSALADALAWAVKHPNPDPSNPAERFRWKESMHMQNSGPMNYGQGMGCQSQMPLSSVPVDRSFPVAHEYQLQQNGDFHLGHTGDAQDGFGDQTNIPLSTSQAHPVLRGLDFSSVVGADQLYPRGMNYFEVTKPVASGSPVYNRYDVGSDGFCGASVSFGVVPENTEVNASDRNHAPHQKLDADAQMLLDSFAAYDRMSTNDNALITASGVNGTLPPEVESHAAQNDQLAGLLEAVTSAVGQEAAQSQVADKVDAPPTTGHPRRTQRSVRVPTPPLASRTGRGSTGSNGERKRKAGAKLIQKENGQQCQTDPVVADGTLLINQQWAEPAINESRDGMNDCDGEVDAEVDSLEIRELPPQIALSDARAAGVHSAAALFRRPSASSKKYTRPPMSKLFASLELSPENFLHLQAAAKAFMLDKNHPERQNCVGSRGKSDTDMIKLKLYNCVNEFLEVEGNGEKFFGRNVPSEGGKKKFVWPAQQHKIISLVTPLLRRMVTNERQRQYAIETRKGGGSNKRKFSETETPTRHSSSGPSEFESSVEIDEALFQHFNGRSDGVFVNGGTYEEPHPNIADLGLISGLSQADWNALVAAVQEYSCSAQLGHTGVFVKEMGYLEKSNWLRAGSQDVGADAKQEYAHEIVRDLFSAVARNIGENAQQNTQAKSPARKKRKIASTSIPENNCSSDRQQRVLVASPTVSSHEAGTQTLTPPGGSDHTFDTDASSSSGIKLQIHILQNSQRIHTPFYVYSGKCPDYETFCRAALRGVASGRDFKVQMLLGTGLVGVSGDEEFAEALKGVRETVWMDGEIKVVVELDGQ